MPNKDKTGPEGKGPRTGRGAGSCGDRSGRPKRDGSGAGKGQEGGLRRNARNSE